MKRKEKWGLSRRFWTRKGMEDFLTSIRQANPSTRFQPNDERTKAFMERAEGQIAVVVGAALSGATLGGSIGGPQGAAVGAAVGATIGLVIVLLCQTYYVEIRRTLFGYKVTVGTAN